MYPFWIYLLVASGVTYLIRLLPLLLVKRTITNRFIISFLYYVPYAVLAVMTIPAIFQATDTTVSAVVGFLAAVVLAYFEKGLLTVASCACIAVFIVEYLMNYL